MKRGFTLVEILVVLAIAVLAASLIVSAYLSFRQKADLNTAVENVLNTLRLAQSKTLASEGNYTFGVHLETNQYVLFQGSVYSSGDPNNRTFALPQKVTISGLADVIFEKVTGKPLQTGAITLTESTLNQTKSIFIETSGQMGISTSQTLPPQEPPVRATDSRHVHFTYNPVSDPRNSIILSLNFSGTIFNIDFQTHLNAARDKFNWSGTVNIGGQNQVLRIHTHFLNLDRADFSVTRDKRYNTAALSIYLDGENLINYDLNGATTQGISSFVSAPAWQ